MTLKTFLNRPERIKALKEYIESSFNAEVIMVEAITQGSASEMPLYVISLTFNDAQTDDIFLDMISMIDFQNRTIKGIFRPMSLEITRRFILEYETFKD